MLIEVQKPEALDFIGRRDFVTIRDVTIAGVAAVAAVPIVMKKSWAVDQRGHGRRRCRGRHLA